MQILKFLASVWGVSDALAPEIPENENEKIQALKTENQKIEEKIAFLNEEIVANPADTAALQEKAKLESRVRDNHLIMQAYGGRQGYF